MTKHKLIVNGFRGLATTGLVSLLVACGGGGGEGEGGSGSDDQVSGGSVPIVTRGVITQLGSIWVNGCRYVAAPGGTYKSDDDDSASFDDYEVGQLVSIRGRRNDDGISCVADEVEYEAEIEGAAGSDGKINGIEIVQTPKTNNTTPGAPDPLTNDDRYKVSGIWIDDFTIEATFIKEDDDANDEIKGIVKNDGPTSFDVREITFNWTGTPDVSDDDFVEVHFDSCVGTAPNVICNATIVELEDDVFDQAEGMEVEIEGAVNKDVSSCVADGITGADFKIDNICIDWDSTAWMDGLMGSDDVVEGSRVEAEGHVINGLLVAEKIKGRGNRVRISSVAENVLSGPPCTFTLVEGKISVTVLDCVNAFKGDADNSGGPLNISNVDGEEVEVRGVRTNHPGEMMAIRIKASGLSGGGDRHEIRAEVDFGGVNEIDRQVTVLGVITQGVAGVSGTELELNDAMYPGTLDQFLNRIDDNNDATDGPRDVIDVDFDIDPGDGSISSPYEAHQYEIEEEDD